MPQPKKKGAKKKEKRMVPSGVACIQASFNNTVVTIADMEGNVICWSSSGSLGFKGSRKGTPFAAQQASFTAATKAKDNAGLRSVDVKVSGPGAGRESAVRALGSVGIEVRSIRDTTILGRAETVKQFLVELGVPDASVRVVTIGQNGSLCDDPGKECHQINRRVHLEIRKLAGASVAPVRATPAGGTEPETRSRQAPSLP